MKIGIVSEWFERGSSYVTKIYAEQLKLQGQEVFIYARNEYRENNAAPWEGENTTFGAKTDIPFGKAVDKSDFKKWIQQNQITHILFNEQIWIGPVLWAREMGIVTIAYVDYYTRRTIKDFIAYDLLICNTIRHLQAFSWHPNAIYIKWGTDLELFVPSLSKYDSKAQIKFLHSCGWSPYRKGTDLILTAVQMIPEINFELTIHTQIDLCKFLEKENPSLLHTLNDSRIKVIHETVEAPGLYANHDVYIYPTRLEGIGLSQLEAQACGLPLIVPNNPPMNELTSGTFSQILEVSRFFRRKDGYYWDMCEVEPRDIALAIGFFMRSRAEIPNLKKKARKFAEANFNLQRNFMDLSNILQKLEVMERNRFQIYLLKVRRFSYTPQYLISPLIFKVWITFKKVMKKGDVN
jgi:glycosyltransferase involved in cell wall biosynthesis